YFAHRLVRMAMAERNRPPHRAFRPAACPCSSLSSHRATGQRTPFGRRARGRLEAASGARRTRQAGCPEEKGAPGTRRGRKRSLPQPPLACRQSVSYILYRMVNRSVARLDASFAALSDATRRGVLEQLGRSDASISDLADKFHMTLAGMMKHVGILEEARLVTTEKVGRVRTCKLGARRLEEEAA